MRDGVNVVKCFRLSASRISATGVGMSLEDAEHGDERPSAEGTERPQRDVVDLEGVSYVIGVKVVKILEKLPKLAGLSSEL